MALRTPPTITLYRGFAAGGRGSHVWSSFVNKLEARLRIGGVPYGVGVGSPREAPRGKLPYVKIEGSPELLGDTTLITRTFVETGLMADLNAGLTPVQKAQDLAVRALLEDKLCFFQVSTHFALAELGRRPRLTKS